jgi:archaellum component FlaC
MADQQTKSQTKPGAELGRINELEHGGEDLPDRQVQSTAALVKAIHDLEARIDTKLLVERVRSAEKHSDYMRNWLALLSVVVTLLLAFAGYLGLRSYSDIQNTKEQLQKAVSDIKSEEEQVQTDASNVRDTAKDLTRRAETAGTTVANVETRIQEMNSRLEGLNSSIDLLKSKTAEFQRDLNANSFISQQNRVDTNNLQANLGSIGIGPMILGTPLILKVGIPATLRGENFGAKPGKLWVAIQSGSFSLTPADQAGQSHEASIQDWTDSNITFLLSSEVSTALDEEARHKRSNTAIGSLVGGEPVPGVSSPNYDFLSFRVESSSGQFSLWSAAIPWSDSSQ